MHDFEFDLSTDSALAETAAVQASVLSAQADVDPDHCDLESGREFTQTIGNHSNAINTADIRGVDTDTRGAERSAQGDAVTRIQALLDRGPLAEAQVELKKASLLFPELPELWELDLDIREKAIRIRNLVERGEEQLKDTNFQDASGSFGEALQLLPADPSLGSRIATVLRLYAGTIEQVDPQAAQSALLLLRQIQPMTGPSAIAEEPKSPLEPEILQIIGTDGHTDSADSAAPGSLQVIDVGRPPRGRSLTHLFAVLALAAALFIVLRIVPSLERGAGVNSRNVLEIPEIIPGTLTIHSNVADVAVLINNRTLNLPAGALAAALQLSPNTYEIRALRAGYAVFGPISTTIKSGSNTTVDLQLKANPAALEITNAEPGTKVMLDGQLLGVVSKSGTLISEVTPGRHSVELSREGFLSMSLLRKFNSGEASTLSGADIALESSDARMITPKRGRSNVAVVKAEEPKPLGVNAALKDLVSTLPPRLQAAAAADIPPPPKVQTPAPAPPLLIADLERRASVPDLKRLENPESGAVLDALRRFSEAWNAKDVKTITSIQRDLDKRALKAQLAPVRTIAMKISPVMPPQFDGAHATVICRRQANEIFSDGSARQNPETIVTYVLSKHDGVWAIDHAQ